MRQMGFMVNLLIVLSSAIIAITPAIIGAAETELDSLRGMITTMVWLAASSIAVGVVVSIFRLLEFRYSYWQYMTQRPKWNLEQMTIDRRKALKYSTRYGIAKWPILAVQGVLWLSASYFLVMTIIGLLTIDA